MKVRRLVVKNVSSYRERTEFVFDSGINILIGPNGGGKTNCQKIISLTLSKYFIYQYQFRRDNEVVSVEVVDPWTKRILPQIFPKFMGDDSEQLIEIELAPEKKDIENIRAIGSNLDKLNQQLGFWEKHYKSYAPLEVAGAIRDSDSFLFVIRDLELEEPQAGTAAWGFREYLREFFIFLRVASQIPELSLSSPVFFFSSDRALQRNFEVQAGNLSEQSQFDGYRSAYQAATGESMNLMQWGAQHFVRLHRRAVIDSSKSDKQWREFFDASPDVQLLSKYIRQLGYGWGFNFDNDQLSYWFHLIKDSEQLPTSMFSSGEREIVHFLLAMFALNVQDGLILVDEPELHLHPRWQKIFLRLFRDLSADRNNQFVITTHSPTFVTPDTIDDVTRIYRSKGGSTHVALRDVKLPEKKNLVRMVNSQNNERLFFADKVVLVEGISDRLILSSLIDLMATRFNVNAAIEVIETGGKHNFRDYMLLLSGLKTPAVAVADQDYLATQGASEIRGLFVMDFRGQWKTLNADRKSTDRKSMIHHLYSAVQTGDLEELRKFWDYFTNRKSMLKKEMADAERTRLSQEYSRLEQDNIFVLHEGEIEDYLPEGCSDVRGIVSLISDRNWICRVDKASKQEELVRIVCRIIDLLQEQENGFLEELRLGKAVFTEKGAEKVPISEDRAASPSLAN